MQGQERFAVRRLQVADVYLVLKIIKECRLQHTLEARMEAILEPGDEDLFETYRNRRSAYFVATVDDQVVGGAGISRLSAADGSICELRRMYLRKESRGLGIGQELLRQCLQAARHFGYQHCYAETASQMKTAIAFYERHDFRHLTAPLGDTGHNHNDCWLLLELQPQRRVVGF